jgi:hypothetical protein
MFTGILILAVVILLGSAAAIQISVSPAELREMGVRLDNPQF